MGSIGRLVALAVAFEFLLAFALERFAPAAPVALVEFID